MKNWNLKDNTGVSVGDSSLTKRLNDFIDFYRTQYELLYTEPTKVSCRTKRNFA
jgi:hypothetical protein